MTYKIQNFIDGQRLTAAHMNHIEKGIIDLYANDIPRVFIDGAIPATKDDVLATMRFVSNTIDFFAYIKIKCQGTSSMAYPKKNFTVKLYSDEARETKLKKTFMDWDTEEYKFCLKANYIDHSHARNIICANMWTDVVASRSDYASLPESLQNSPKNGAVDGFPIRVYTNGSYQGLYTWNIPKDAWTFNMDEDNPNHVLLCAETNTNGVYAENACNFRALWNGVDGYDWSIEVGSNSDDLKNSLNALISCVMDADDATFKNTIGNHLDIQSAIDYYIHQYVICGIDGLAKNMLLATYDGAKWICGAYDMDSTLGLWWDGAGFVSATTRCPEEYQEPYSLLWERIEALYADEIKNRYLELRETVYSYESMAMRFEQFTASIGKDLYAEDLEEYPSIPSGTTNNIKQIRDFIRDRLAYTDQQLAPTPCTGLTLTAESLNFTDETPQSLGAIITPDGCTDAAVWSSSNRNIASVSNGLVTPLNSGECEITVTCGEYSASCKVSVSDVGVPADYDVLSYIESTGTQYIDTGIYGGSNAAYEIRMNTLSTHATEYEQYFAGEMATSPPKLFRYGGQVSAQNILGETPISIRAQLVDLDFTVRYETNGDLYINGVKHCKLSLPPDTGWGTQSWYVCNAHGENTLFATMKLYYLKMYTDGVLVVDFIPVRRKTDGEIGLYNRVTEVFHQNCGTGTFLYG